MLLQCQATLAQSSADASDNEVIWLTPACIFDELTARDLHRERAFSISIAVGIQWEWKWECRSPGRTGMGIVTREWEGMGIRKPITANLSTVLLSCGQLTKHQTVQ